MDIMHLIFSLGDIITGLLGALTDNTNNPDMVDTPLIFVGGFLKGLFRGIQKGLKKLTLGKVLSFAVPLIATGGLGALGKLSLGGIVKSAFKNALPNIAVSAIAKGKKFGLQDVVGALREGAISGAMGQIDNATAGRLGQMMGLTQGLQSGDPLTMLASLQGMGDMMRGGQSMGAFTPSSNPEMQPPMVSQPMEGQQPTGTFAPSVNPEAQSPMGSQPTEGQQRQRGSGRQFTPEQIQNARNLQMGIVGNYVQNVLKNFRQEMRNGVPVYVDPNGKAYTQEELMNELNKNLQKMGSEGDIFSRVLMGHRF